MREDRPSSSVPRRDYEARLRALQIELVKWQRRVIADGEKVAILFEGRDGAGKDGTIKRLAEHLSPRETRVVALGKPSDREVSEWYFQRWAEHLPAAGEVVLFNRSWYNRAGVERVMGFCTAEQAEHFLRATPVFEGMLTDEGIRLFKYYLDIDREEQRHRLADRRKDPLKQWKLSPVDAAALGHWNDYSAARDEMLRRTSHAGAPWFVVKADDKRVARLNVIADLLSRVRYRHKDRELASPDRSVVFPFDASDVGVAALAH